MKNKKIATLISITLIFTVLLIAFSTNPNVDTHKAEVKNKFGVELQKSLTDNVDPNGMGLAISYDFTSMFGDAAINILIDTLICSDNYLFFSITKLNWNGKSKVIGLGLFGQVFLSNDLNKPLKGEPK